VANVSYAVARVYAQALLQAAQAQRCVGQVHADLHALDDYIAATSDFRDFFRSPRVDRFTKWKLLDKALRGQVHDLVLGLVRTLMLRGRGPIFDNVVRQFDRYRDLAENRVRAELTTAVKLPPEVIEALRERLARASGKTVEVVGRVDPEVLGGASLRVGDRRLDGTVRRRLQVLRDRLLSPETESVPR
jgi:F-type H+-transporting ATPase subunit delta